jgi:DNA-binding CsgD family transcriptional regulator/tetratricopeptide (TPR) repeat protein
VSDVTAGRGGSLWVEGEPGIGKSALLAAGLADAQARGCRVFWTAADEADQRVPLRVLLDALRVGPDTVDPERRRIAGMLRGEGTLGAATPRDVPASAAERLLDLVHRECAAGPVLLVIDDIQWADELSLAMWVRLHRSISQLPLLLAAARRPVPARPEVAAVRRSLMGGAEVVELGALSPEEVDEMVARLVGAQPGPRLRSLIAKAGGSPLFVRELVDVVRREGCLRREAGSTEATGKPATSVPTSLTAAIEDRLRPLSAATAAVLPFAALLGSEFSLSDLEALTRRPTVEVVATVEEAMTAGVLDEAGERLTFRHGLIRTVLADSVPPAVRQALHRQAAEALAAAGAPAEQVAWHLVVAGSAADGWMLDWLSGAAPALVHRAPEMAVELLARARSAAGPRAACLEAHHVTALSLLSRHAEVEDAARAALTWVRHPEAAGRIGWAQAYALSRLGRYPDAIVAVQQTLQRHPLPTTWRLRLRSLRVMFLVSSHRYDEADLAIDEALAGAELSGDRLARGYALHALSIVRSRHHRDPLAMVETIDRALAAVGDEPETTDLRLVLLGNRAMALDNHGRLGEAEHTIAEALTLAERSATPNRLAATRLQTAQHCFLVGRWDDALSELDGATEALRDDPVRWIWLNGVGALLAVHRDDRPARDARMAAVTSLRTSAAELRYHGVYLLVARALAAERDGAPRQALRLLLEACQPSAPEELDAADDGYLWLPDIIRLAQMIGDTATATAAVATAAAEARQTAGPLTQAAAEHCQGLLLTDPARLLAAADAYGEAPAPLYRGQALENAAALYARHGDTASARAAYADAVAVYEKLEAAWDLLRARERLRAAGLRRGVHTPRRRPATGWKALTPTELTVARLVASGMSNPDIAAQLFLSRRTVHTHVAHVMAKLDVHSRVAIAREASAH